MITSLQANDLFSISSFLLVPICFPTREYTHFSKLDCETTTDIDIDDRGEDPKSLVTMAKRNSRKKATRKQHQLRFKEREEREDDDDNDDEVVEDDADSESEQHEGDDMENGGDDVEDSDSHNDSDDSEEEEDDDMDIAAVFHGKSGAADDDDEEEDDDDDDSDSEEKRLVAAAGATAASMSSDQYIFDLRKLLAVDNDQIPHSVLYRKPGDTPNKASSDGKSITIPLDESLGLTINEDFLLSRVTEGCTQLINALWQLPTEQSDAGPLVTLPGYDEIILPRALVSCHKIYGLLIR